MMLKYCAVVSISVSSSNIIFGLVWSGSSTSMWVVFAHMHVTVMHVQPRGGEITRSLQISRNGSIRLPMSNDWTWHALNMGNGGRLEETHAVTGPTPYDNVAW